MSIVPPLASLPLSHDEQLELVGRLEESGGRTLVFARGVFAATATTSREVEPTEWLGLILGGETPGKAQLARIFKLLIRDFFALAARMARGEPVVPESSDADVVREFCRGYMQMAQKDPSWTGSQRAFALTLPAMVLSEYVTPDSLQAVAPAAISDTATYLNQSRQQLGDSLKGLYELFGEARRQRDLRTAAAASEKVGRNEPCPCGSGKKYKKCCATPGG